MQWGHEHGKHGRIQIRPAARIAHLVRRPAVEKRRPRLGVDCKVGLVLQRILGMRITALANVKPSPNTYSQKGDNQPAPAKSQSQATLPRRFDRKRMKIHYVILGNKRNMGSIPALRANSSF